MVSIHASSREDATLFPAHFRRTSQFQSTRPRGRTRLASEMLDSAKLLVSIHASSREDATFCQDSPIPLNRFNPRVLAGGRDFTQFKGTSCVLFQSTRPRGRTRPETQTHGRFQSLFQSTRPRGRTRLLCVLLKTSCASFNPRVLAGGRDCFM